MPSLISLALINIGCLVALLAVVFKDDIKKRLGLMIGSAIFLIGFTIGNDYQAWYAALWALAFALVNGGLLAKELQSKSTSKFTKREKVLYQAFKGLNAEEFKDLLKITTWNSPQEHTTLTSEDEICDSLFYVLKGKTEVSKEDRIFTLSANTFIGEVGYFLRSGASATTIVEKGSTYVAWKTSELRTLEENSPAIRAKLYELINKDMAAKVAASKR